MSRVIRIAGVQVGTPQPITLTTGDVVSSGIFKTGPEGETVGLTLRNLEGDGQADLRVHGSPDQAVYVYPAVHLPRWTAELEYPSEIAPGMFGENLTIAELDEETASIGDVWEWGDALLQITQPRLPCAKLAGRLGRADAPRQLIELGRTGWYMRVLQPGRVTLAGNIVVRLEHPAGVTVRMAHESRKAEASMELRARVLECDALSFAWRERVVERMG